MLRIKQRIIFGALACIVLMLGGMARAEEATQQEVPMQDVQRFSAAISHIKSFYVEQIKDEKLFEDAIRGMLSGLDPHSDYLNAEEFNDLKVATQGEYGGLGIEITMQDGILKIIAPIDGTPASRAKLQSGDLILKLDNKAVKGLTLRQAVEHMRGQANSDIVLTIYRATAKKNPLLVKLKREVIRINTVTSKLLGDRYGYVRISHFQEPTAGAFAKAVESLRIKASNNKLCGLVLDLRNNPGGLLDTAIEVSDHLIHSEQGKEKVIVMTKGRVAGTEFTANARAGDLMQGAPIVVLINEGSASGSEIVAGALQDNKRGVILGTKSFGKGSVQTVLPLDEKHGIKLTTARYYTPSGRSIQATGIVPDVVVTEAKLAEVEKELEEKYAVKESDLLRHLTAGGDKHNEQQDKAKQELQTLAKDDAQLYHAVVLLQALDVLQEKHKHDPRPEPAAATAASSK